MFGAGGKRRLVASVLTAPDRRWTEAQLARAAGLHSKGSVDEHVAAMVQLGLLARDGLTLRLVGDSPLADPLRQLLGVLDQLPDEPIDRP